MWLQLTIPTGDALRKLLKVICARSAAAPYSSLGLSTKLKQGQEPGHLGIKKQPEALIELICELLGEASGEDPRSIRANIRK